MCQEQSELEEQEGEMEEQFTEKRTRRQQIQQPQLHCWTHFSQIFKPVFSDPKTHKRLKERFLDKTRQDANFRGKPLFQSYVQYKNKHIT